MRTLHRVELEWNIYLCRLLSKRSHSKMKVEKHTHARKLITRAVPGGGGGCPGEGMDPTFWKTPKFNKEGETPCACVPIHHVIFRDNLIPPLFFLSPNSWMRQVYTLDFHR